MTNDSHKRMFSELKDELDQLLDRRAQLDRQIARLRQALIGLDRVVTGESAQQKPEALKAILGLRSKVGLKDMVIEVLRGAYRPLTPAEVVKGLEELRYDFGKTTNKTGAVTVTLIRLAGTGEVKIHKKDGKKSYEWQG